MDEVAEDENEDAGQKFQTICCSLNKALSQQIPEEQRQKFKTKIDQLVLVFSKLTHECSLFASYIFRLHCENPQGRHLEISTKDQLQAFYESCFRNLVSNINQKKTKNGTKTQSNNQTLEQKIKQNEIQMLQWKKLQTEKETCAKYLLSKEYIQQQIDRYEYQKIIDEERLQTYEKKKISSNWMNDVKWPSSLDPKMLQVIKGYTHQYAVIGRKMATNCLESVSYEMLNKRLFSTLHLNYERSLANKMKSLILADDLLVMKAKLTKMMQTEYKDKPRQKNHEKTCEILKTKNIQAMILEYRKQLQGNFPSIKQAKSCFLQRLRFFYFLLGILDRKRVQIQEQLKAQKVKKLKVDLETKEEKVQETKKTHSKGPKLGRLRSWHLVPYHAYNLFFLEIQKKTFSQLLKDVHKKPRPAKNKKKNQKSETNNRQRKRKREKKEQVDLVKEWSTWFDLKQCIRGQKVGLPDWKWEFANSIKTDGVKVCLTLQPAGTGYTKNKQKGTKDVSEKRQKKINENKEKKNRKENKNNKEDKKPLPYLFRETGNCRIWTDHNVQATTLDLVSIGARCISIDPGKIDLVTIKSGTNYSNISRKQWQHWRQANPIRLRKLFEKQKFETDPEHQVSDSKLTNKEALAKQSEQCFYVQKSQHFLQQWQNRVPLEEQLYAFYQKKTFAKHRFLSYQHKQSALRKVCLKILGNQNPVLEQNRTKNAKSKTEKEKKVNSEVDLLYPKAPRVICYGAAKFSTSGEGGSAPLGAIPRALAQFPNTYVIMTDEYGTSQTCSGCNRQVEKVKIASWVRLNKDETKEFHSLTTEEKRKTGCKWKKTQRKSLSYPIGMERKLPKVYKQIREHTSYRLLACTQQSCCHNKRAVANKRYFHRDRLACDNIQRACLSRIFQDHRHLPLSMRRTKPPWADDSPSCPNTI
jgi:hypothetical protein